MKSCEYKKELVNGHIVRAANAAQIHQHLIACSISDRGTMTQLLGRVVVLVNETNRVIQLKESRRFAPDGVYSYTIQLDPFDNKKIGATMFHRRAKEAARPTVIRIFVDGVECFNKFLTPQAFIDYFQISFGIGEDEKVTVRGVRSTQTADHLRRIRLIGCLIRGLRFLVGSDDHGGQKEDIA